jgi:hypothetical protein
MFQVIPPYNGFGSLEDTLQSCLSLIPQPPKKDFIRMLENDNKVLRYSAVMVCILATCYIVSSCSHWIITVFLFYSTGVGTT